MEFMIGSTNSLGIEGELVEHVGDERLGLSEVVVALPVASYEESSH